MNEPRTYLGWLPTLLRSSSERRQDWVKKILDGLKSYREGKAKSATYLSDVIQDKSEFELIGFAVNACYAKVDGPKEMLDAFWVHPWGTPALMYKHKRLPMIVMVGPGIRFNESILQEVGMDDMKVMGITG